MSLDMDKDRDAENALRTDENKMDAERRVISVGAHLLG